MDYAGIPMSTYDDESLLTKGKWACKNIEDQKSFSGALGEMQYMEPGTKPSLDDVATLLRVSVVNLCPQYMNLIPSLGPEPTTGLL